MTKSHDQKPEADQAEDAEKKAPAPKAEDEPKAPPAPPRLAPDSALTL